MHNTTPAYWETIGLSEVHSKELAYIAGDEHNMSDIEVLVTFINEHEHELPVFSGETCEDCKDTGELCTHN